MGGSSAPKQQTQSSTEPWKAAQPALQRGLTDAMSNYSSGAAFQPYGGSTVVPYSQQSNTAMKQVEGLAGGVSPFLNKNFNMVASNAQMGGLNDIQRGVVNRLTTQATGAFDPNSNPAFQNVLKQATDSAGQAVDMGASAAGRYGSGIHQGNVAREVGNVAGNLTNTEYNNWQNRRDAANAGLFNAGQQQQSNVWQNTDALSNAYDATMSPVNNLMNVGGMYDDLTGRQMNDAMRISEGQKRAPLNAIEWLQAIGSGAGSLGGSTGSSVQGPKANPFGQAIGGLLGVNSLFSGL